MNDSLNMKMFIFYIAFVISTCMTILLLYFDVDHVLSFGFIILYTIFVLSFFVYFLVVAVMKVRHLKVSEIKRRLYSFALSFFLCSIVGMSFHYFLKQHEIDYSVILPIAFGLSLGISFLDVAFTKK